MTKRVYSPDNEPFDVPEARANHLILEKGWTQTPQVQAETPAPAPKKPKPAPAAPAAPADAPAPAADEAPAPVADTKMDTTVVK